MARSRVSFSMRVIVDCDNVCRWYIKSWCNDLAVQIFLMPSQGIILWTPPSAEYDKLDQSLPKITIMSLSLCLKILFYIVAYFLILCYRALD